MRHPIYILSKGRADTCLTANMLLEEGLEFKIAVESEEAHQYGTRYGGERILVLPFNNLKQGATPARNAIKDYSYKRGENFHWALDDNIKQVLRYDRGKGTRCSVSEALGTVERFVDRYTNIAAAGLCNRGFAFSKTKPFQVNIQVYCCVLIDNTRPFHYRGIGAEDTDYSLQVVNAGLCTVLFNCYAIEKVASGTMKGGNKDVVYADGGRERRARQLQEFWPALDIKIRQRWGRTFQDLNHVWRKFKHPLLPPNNNPWEGMPEWQPRGK